MRAMVLRSIGRVADDCRPLALESWPDPVPLTGEVAIKVAACGVCHTELDEIEGRTSPPHLPVIPGHQAVGRIERLGPDVLEFGVGDRVGVAWIFSACGHCAYCRSGRENLCADFRATGRDANGGYAEKMVVPAAFIYPLPDGLTDLVAAPLLCAGAVGYRSLELCGLRDGQTLGFTGFGASAHLVLQLALRKYPNSRMYVFARDEAERAFARELGAHWTGAIEDTAPERLQAIIDTTPAWTPVVSAMRNLSPGGRLVINAIRKEETDKAALARLDYARDLWMEKEIKSVANVTRQDVREFLKWADRIDIQPQVTTYRLDDANRALADLKAGRGTGAKVLKMD